MKPTNKLQSELIAKLQQNNIETDITKRWENGEHNPKAEKLAQEIGDIDWLYNNDSFCFKFGSIIFYWWLNCYFYRHGGNFQHHPYLLLDLQ